ncbi:MAG: Slp family lipoprotein [Acidiferrobacter sp.]
MTLTPRQRAGSRPDHPFPPYGRIPLAACAAALALGGCAVTPRPRAVNINVHLTSPMVVAHPRATRGARVRWGGVIVHDRVGPQHSVLTVLAYPLSRRGRPHLRRMPWGRFKAIAPGYLDPMLYGRGQSVSIVGVVHGVTPGVIGKAHYIYPEIQLLSAHLWPLYGYRRRDLYPRGPRWTFGLGFGFGM